MSLQQIKKDSKILATRLRGVWLVLLFDGKYFNIEKKVYDIKKPAGKIIYTATPQTDFTRRISAKSEIRNLKQKKYRDNKRKLVC